MFYSSHANPGDFVSHFIVPGCCSFMPHFRVLSSAYNNCYLFYLEQVQLESDFNMRKIEWPQ